MIEIDGSSLSLEQIEKVADGAEVTLAPSALPRINRARKFVEDIISSGQVVYGINTGFGALSDVIIPPDKLRELQLNLVRSHSCGVGEPLPERVVRAMMLLRANVLAKGYSGCRVAVIETLLEMLNIRVHPVIPSRGSVGTSGDLAPLAHLAAVVIGEGEAVYMGERMAGGDAMKWAGIETLTLEAKEGLALLNGTQAMCAVGGLALLAAERLVASADVAGAMTLEALARNIRNAVVRRFRPATNGCTSTDTGYGMSAPSYVLASVLLPSSFFLLTPVSCLLSPSPTHASPARTARAGARWRDRV